MAMYRVGYGQVEPNHLANQSTKQSYAQLPAAADIKVLENGQFAKYSYADEEVNFNGVGEWMLVWNEIKLYDGWRDTVKDFALIADNFTNGTYTGYKVQGGSAVENPDQTVYHEGIGLNPDGYQFGGKMYPRLIKTEVGDIITTNCFNIVPDTVATATEAGRRVKVAMANLDQGDYVAPNAKGYLAKVENANGDFVWRVAKVYTMPDGQPGVKLQRVK